MKVLSRTAILFLLLSFWAGVCWPIDKTPTEFYYPTGTSDLGTYAGWLASGCLDNHTYFDGEYHIGHDFKTVLSAPVYSIADGEIVAIGYNGWGEGNKAVFVRHRKSNG